MHVATSVEIPALSAVTTMLLWPKVYVTGTVKIEKQQHPGGMYGQDKHLERSFLYQLASTTPRQPPQSPVSTPYPARSKIYFVLTF